MKYKYQRLSAGQYSVSTQICSGAAWEKISIVWKCRNEVFSNTPHGWLNNAKTTKSRAQFFKTRKLATEALLK